MVESEPTCLEKRQQRREGAVQTHMAGATTSNSFTQTVNITLVISHTATVLDSGQPTPVVATAIAQLITCRLRRVCSFHCSTSTHPVPMEFGPE